MANRTFKTGTSREQATLLPARVEDYVGADNPVRAIDAYVGSLNLAGLGFRHAERRAGGSGQPPYDPGDLLKLYLYGYTNQVRSSRRLAREACRNLEVMWLLGGLRPGYRTIAAFRAENWSALKRAKREFVLLVSELGLLDGTLVAIDGAFFHGDASKCSIATRRKLEKQLAALDEGIEAYGEALASNDASEDAASASGEDGGDGDGPGRRMKALLAQRACRQAELAELEASGERQLSRTDPDARLLSKNGQRVAGYNVQIAVDGKHKLIVADEVVNDGNDTGQLHAMALSAKQALGVDRLRAVADAGYYNGVELKACEDTGIVAYVPLSERGGRMASQGRFTHHDFTYDAAADVCRCPGGAQLQPTKTLKRNAGRLERRYVSRKADCDACAVRGRCLAARAMVREIYRWEHADVLERHRERMSGADAHAVMRRRASLAEHPFGTLKCRAGYRHFLVRGFDKVRGEWSLMALCYNLTRLIRIVGPERLIALLAERRSALLLALAIAATGRRCRAICRLLADHARKVPLHPAPAKHAA